MTDRRDDRFRDDRSDDGSRWQENQRGRGTDDRSSGGSGWQADNSGQSRSVDQGSGRQGNWGQDGGQSQGGQFSGRQDREDQPGYQDQGYRGGGSQGAQAGDWSSANRQPMYGPGGNGGQDSWGQGYAGGDRGRRSMNDPYGYGSESADHRNLGQGGRSMAQNGPQDSGAQGEQRFVSSQRQGGQASGSQSSSDQYSYSLQGQGGRYGQGGSGQGYGMGGSSQGGVGWQNRQSHQGKGPKGYQRSDDRIKESVEDALSDDHDVDASEIEVQVQGGEVTLTGTVNDRAQKRRAEDVVERLRGVNDVHNQLRVNQQGRGMQGQSGTQNQSGQTQNAQSQGDPSQTGSSGQGQSGTATGGTSTISASPAGGTGAGNKPNDDVSRR